MSVERILAGKGRDVISIDPQSTLAEAARMLNHHRIGAIVVIDVSEALVGILSERDVVRAVAEGGADALRQPVSSRMTGNVVTCRPDAGIDELMTLMTERKFRHVPIVEGGRLRGIVSIGDIVKQRLSEIETEHRALRDYIATA